MVSDQAFSKRFSTYLLKDPEIVPRAAFLEGKHTISLERWLKIFLALKSYWCAFIYLEQGKEPQESSEQRNGIAHPITIKVLWLLW